MSRITSGFQKSEHKALIPYLTVGYPRLNETADIALWLADNGADIIELGIPFSDPLADGATIQASSYRALQNGVTPEYCLETATKIRSNSQVPLVFMTYFNPILSYGIEDFCRDSLKAGVDGLIVPDLPPEEASLLEKASLENNLDLVYLLSPTSTSDRIRLVAEKSRGFIYLVSVTGVTGTRRKLPTNLVDFVSRVRQTTQKPLYLGFGISTPEQAKEVSSIADGVIVGSRLIQLMESDFSFPELKAFFRQLRLAIDS
jgi:tryptophan synthase alpha chain